MSTEDVVAALRNDFTDLRSDVRAWGKKIDTIHAAVERMADKVYVPGPPRRSLWSRIGSIFGVFLF